MEHMKIEVLKSVFINNLGVNFSKNNKNTYKIRTTRSS